MQRHIWKVWALRLFQELGTALIYNKPEDPEPLCRGLKRLKEKEKVQQLGSSIFTETDVETMFGCLIRLEQVL